MTCYQKASWKIVMLAWVVWSLSAFESYGQLTSQFGKNKVHYQDFRWATLTTPHFILYFYQGEELLAQNASKMAERSYAYLSTFFQHQFSEHIPLIIYASSDDFQQTEVIEGMLGEGLGGVTESLRGRIIMPFLGSYREFNHVLLHELVHAFQFDILEQAGASLMFFSDVSIPLWFVEGMAEYLTADQPSLTDMWVYDAVVHDTLPTARALELLRDIRVYRLGEVLVRMLADQYGDQILGDLLREMGNGHPWEQAFKTLTESAWNDVYTTWKETLEAQYAAEADERLPPERHAQLLIAHREETFFLNILPAISPDGQYVAFISDRDFYRTIYLASATTGELLKPLVEGERRGTYETLRFLHTSLAWAPDSRHIAFNARAGGQNAIYVLDIESQEVVQTLTPTVTSVGSLAWSPDGRQIAFSGTRNGQEDLFLITVATGEITQITDDLFSNRHPAWSPDGLQIAFTTDAGSWSDREDLQFGPSNVALYHHNTGRIRLVTNSRFHDLNPVWSPDGRWLACISDRTGLYNLYILPSDLERASMVSDSELIQVTNVNTGIVGLTPDNPALSWASETGTLVFSGFSDRGWNIYSLPNPIPIYRAYRAEVGDTQELQAAPAVPDESLLPEKKDWEKPLPDRMPSETEKYTARLRPDYILGGGGGNAERFILLARIGFSDMLGNHQLRIGGNFTQIFDESDFIIEYANLSRRLSYYAALFQFDRNLGVYRRDEGDFEVDVERGLGLTWLWPFDKFRRMEFGIEGRMTSGTLLPQDDTTPAESEEQRELDEQITVSTPVAYVHDTTLYTAIGPLDGRRSRFAAYPTLGDLTYLTLVADQRWYWHLTRRSVLACRAMMIGSVGEQVRLFEIGSPDTFRGRQSSSADKLLGSKVVLGNLEYRFPLLPKLNFLRGTVFVDTALVWDETVQPFTSAEHGGIKLKDLHAAYGAGLRIPVYGPFGLVNIRIDMAQETDLTRNIGKRSVVFSIGSDF